MVFQNLKFMFLKDTIKQTDPTDPMVNQIAIKLAIANRVGYDVPALPNHIWMEITKLVTSETAHRRRMEVEKSTRQKMMLRQRFRHTLSGQ